MMKISTLTMFTMACILCALLVCGCASAASSPDSFHIKLDIKDGLCNKYGFLGYHIIDGDYHVKSEVFLSHFPPRMSDLDKFRKGKRISLSDSGLNPDKPFKRVKLHFALGRKWGFFLCHDRLDMFTLDVTDLVTKNENEYCVQLKVRNSYKVAKADAITIYDDKGHKLKYFPPTRKTGLHGKWDV